MEEIKSSFSGVNKIIEEYKKQIYIVSFVQINGYDNSQIWNVEMFFEEKDCFKFIMNLLEKAVNDTDDYFELDTSWFDRHGHFFHEYFGDEENDVKYIGKFINLEIIDYIILCLNSSRVDIRQYYYNIVKK